MNSLRSAWTPVLAGLPKTHRQAKGGTEARPNQPSAVRDILSIELVQKTGQITQVEVVNWDDVVLPGPVGADIRAIIRLLVPGTAEQLGVPVPTGLVLVGQPGTGKTLVARLIASQAQRSFYAITPATSCQAQ